MFLLSLNSGAGVLYRHPPMPPMVVGVSKSKNKPYYYHPDSFLSSHLPSANGDIVAANSAYAISRLHILTGGSPADESSRPPLNTNSRDSHGTTPALRVGSTTTAFTRSSIRSVYRLNVSHSHCAKILEPIHRSTVPALRIALRRQRIWYVLTCQPNVAHATEFQEIPAKEVSMHDTRTDANRFFQATDTDSVALPILVLPAEVMSIHSANARTLPVSHYYGRNSRRGRLQSSTLDTRRVPLSQRKISPTYEGAIARESESFDEFH
jgi:hypothetical protein